MRLLIYHAAKTSGGVEIHLHVFLTLGMDGGGGKTYGPAENRIGNLKSDK